MPEPRDTVQPAEHYAPCDDLWVVTAYFNSTHSRNRQANYHVFADRIRRSGLHLLTVECAFGDDDYELSADPAIVQVRSRHVLWQKERLLNLAVERVPQSIRKIVWLDCDVLFTDPEWAVATARLLDVWPVVQPFQHVIQLGVGATEATADDGVWESFGSVVARQPAAVRSGPTEHGRTGFGWAYRRDIIAEHGLYDGGIVGDGDHVMAHAMVGDFTSGCAQNAFRVWQPTPTGPVRVSPLRRLYRRWLARLVRPLLGRQPKATPINTHHYEHYKAWGERFYADVHGQVSFTPGTVLHLWHGSPANRRYGERRRALVENAYSPTDDIRLNAQGCWEWNSHKPALHAAVEQYFHLRNEDDK